MEEAKEREAQLQGRIRSLEKRIQSLTDREQEVRAHEFLMRNISHTASPSEIGHLELVKMV